MTVATKDGFGTPARRALAAKPAWRRLWQVPLLILGLVGFAVGLRALVQSIRPVPFDKQVHGLEGLIAQENYSEAIKQINALAPYYTQPQQQGELQRLSGDAIYLAQRQQAPVRKNYQAVVDHYQKALDWGLMPSAQMNERWGDCALALGDAKTAIDKLDAAIATSGDSAGILDRHGRDLVAAYLEASQPAKALAMVDRMLAHQKPPEATDIEGIERLTWSLCKRIEIALASHNNSELDQAVLDARKNLPALHEKDPVGRVLVWIGRAELEKGQTPAAEKDLADARASFAVHHMDDGRAAVLLGKILESRGDLPGAAALFQEVVVGHAGTPVWGAARLGRADTAIRRGMLGGAGGEQIFSDFRYVIAALQDTQTPVGKRPELLTLPAVQASLLDAYQRAADADKLDDALTFLAMAAQTQEHVDAETIYRQATTKERRAQELLAEADKAPVAKKAELLAAGRAMLADAATDYLAHGDLTTLNDEQSGASRWRAASLLDAAGETDRAIAVYERLTIQRPRDPRVSEGLLALGRLYESAGETDKAVAAYERNIKENPKTPASYASIVNLARCYARQAQALAKPEDRKALLAKAEQLLLGLVQDKTDLQPSAREFRASLLELGQMYYDDRQWGDAILRLDEVVARYPDDGEMPRVIFMLGESYRKSAADIATALLQPAVEHRAELEKARSQRLLAAAGYYSRVVGMLDVEAVAAGSLMAPSRKLTALEEQYLRASYMNRAQCYFERGDYEQAVKLYDETSARFSDEVLAVEAYVQIVNAYTRMNQPPQAAAAAQRGQWILQRVPDASFEGDPARSRDYYKRLLTLK